MIAEKYGVGLVMFDGDESAHHCVQFGDGLTRILTTVWDKDNVGLKIARVAEGNPPHKTDGNEIHIMFDNPKSIDTMIGMLEYIKKVMTED